MKYLIALMLAGVGTPALAQHQGHNMPMQPTEKQVEEETDETENTDADAQPSAMPMDHSKMDHSKMNHGAMQSGSDKPMDHSTMEHGQMNRGAMMPVGQGQAESTKPMPGGMDHSKMDHGAMQSSSTTPMNHSEMGRGEMNHGSMMDKSQNPQGAAKTASGDADHSQMDHSMMDHTSMSVDSGANGKAMGGQMDHSSMDNAAMGQDSMAMDIPSGPAPASAGSGPANAADVYWGAQAMDEARDLLRREQGAQKYFWFQGDRVEYRAREDADGYLFDLQGYYGGDLDKFWFKSEGEGSFGEEIEGVEVQALYSRAIAPFFDLQAGIRQDFAPMDRTYAVVGIQGLAPYLFEVDAAAFLSDRGDLTARVEAELDQRVTQRLVLQPRAEVSFSAQDVPELGIGAGIDTIEAGLRLRYHFAREFAPYIGIDREWKVGQSADYARLEGEDPSVTNYVVGVRFWF